MPIKNPFKKTSLEDEMINLRLTSKSMQRSAMKCQKNEKVAIAKVKKAIQAGNLDQARIYGQDAIREKNQALNSQRLASRIDATASRVETAVRMGQVSKSMAGVTRSMGTALKSMDADKISKTMDKFEQQFEDLDVKTGYMDDAMNATTATSTPADQVDELIGMVADENRLDLGEEFAEAGLVGNKVPESQKVNPSAENDDLQARLANLKT